MKRIEIDETRQMIREFSEAFGRPVNDRPWTPPIEDRLLLGKLLLEETLEYITKGLGLGLMWDDGIDPMFIDDRITCVNRGDSYNVVEAADGLGDINVIIHFNALWEGIDLTAVTNEIHRSNMSKLDSKDKPIINGVTKGYEHPDDLDSELMKHTTLFDPSKPVGKILKGPRYSPPNLLPILGIIPDEEEE